MSELIERSRPINRVKLWWWRLIHAVSFAATAEALYWRDYAKDKIKEIEERL